MNGEYVCELVRAHYEGDNPRFDTILSQIIAGEERHGNYEVVDRLLSLQEAYR